MPHRRPGEGRRPGRPGMGPPPPPPFLRRNFTGADNLPPPPPHHHRPPPHPSPPTPPPAQGNLAVNVILVCVVVMYGLSMVIVLTIWLTRKHKRYQIDTRVSLMVEQGQMRRPGGGGGGEREGARTTRRELERERTRGKRERHKNDKSGDRRRPPRRRLPRHTRHFILGRTSREVCPLPQEFDPCVRTPPSCRREREVCSSDNACVVGTRCVKCVDDLLCDGKDAIRTHTDADSTTDVSATTDDCVFHSPGTTRRTATDAQDEKRVRFSEHVRAQRYSVSVYSCTELSVSEQNQIDACGVNPAASDCV